MKNTITTFHLVTDFHVSKTYEKNLEEILEFHKDQNKYKKRVLYEHILKKTRVLLKKSKSNVAQAILHKSLRSGTTPVGTCGKSALKNFAYTITDFLCEEESLINRYSNTFMQDFEITKSDLSELNTVLSKTLTVRFASLNETFFTMFKFQ